MTSPRRRSLLLFITLFVSTALCCKNGDYTQLSNGKCYKFFNQYVTYPAARQACINAGGSLASLHMQADNDAIAQWIASNEWEATWLGFRCTQRDLGSCRWEDGTVVDFTNLAVYPPDVSHGGCYFMKAGLDVSGKYNVWLDDDCSRMTNYYMCEETAVAPQGCGAGYSEYNNECYKVGNDAQPQRQALLNCRGDGGDLVSIHSQQQNDFVYNLLIQNNVRVTAWIGLQSDATSLSSWTDGTARDYSNLASSSIPPSSCYAMSDVDLLYPRQWVSEDCQSQSMPYVCKKAKNGYTTTVAPVQTTTVPLPPNQCGQTQFYGQSGSIRSPNYPYNFQGTICNYQINGTSNAVNIQIPAILSGKYWVVDIYSGVTADMNQKIYSFSSNDPTIPIAYSSPTPYMLITFYAEGGSSGSPFIMNFNSTYYPAFSTGYLGLSTLAPYSVQPGTTTVGPVGKCPSSWTYDENRRICYAFTSPNSFNDAQQVCVYNGANLLSIHSQAEEDNTIAILDSIYYPSGYQVWIGGNFRGGQWTWIDNTPFVYTSWLSGNDPTNGNCAAIVSNGPNTVQKGWKPRDCTLNLPSLCYKQPTF